LRWRKRWFLGIPLVALLLLLAGVLILWRPARQMAEQVTLQQLEAAYGGRVTVEAIRLRWGGIELRGVEFWEEVEQDEAPRSWLTLQQVHILLPLRKALDDPPPIERIDIRGVRARLPFDADGQLQLKLPRADEPGIPEIPTDRIVVEDVDVELHFDTAPPLLVRELALTINREMDNWEVTGTIGELLEASWTFSGEIHSTFDQAEAQIACERLTWNWQQVADLPFLPSDIDVEWDRVRAEGTLALDWQLNWSTTEPLDHSGTIRLESTSMELRDLDLPLHLPSGTITAADNRWQFSEMVVELLGGSVELLGHLDWPSETPSETPQLVLEGNARQIDISQVPLERLGISQELGIPRELGGRLEGAFTLEALLSSTIRLSGQATATVSDPQWNQLTIDPMDVTLQLDQWQYEVTNSEWQPPLGTLAFHLTAQDVSWEELVLQIPEIPEELRELQARVGGEVQANLSLQSLTDITTHDLEGTFQLASLKWKSIEGMDLQGNWSWRDGVARLEQLTGRGADGERLSGEGQLPWEPDGEISLQLSLEDLAIGSLPGYVSEMVPESYRETVITGVDPLEGVIAANVSLTGQPSQWQDLATWKATGSLQLDRLTALQETFHQPVLRWRYENLMLEVTELQAQWQETTLQGSGQLSLDAPYPFLLRMNLPEIEAPPLLAAFEVAPPVEWGGTVAGSGQVEGELESGRWKITGSGALREVSVLDFAFDEIPFSLEADRNEGVLQVPEVPFAEGTLALAARLPLQGDQASEIRFEMRELESEQLASLLTELPELPSGRISGTMVATGWEDPARATLRGNWTTSRWEAGPLLVEQGTVQLDLQSGRLDLQAEANVLGGRLHLTGGSPWDPTVAAPWETLDFLGDLTAEGVRLETAVRRLGRDAESLRDLRGLATGVGRVSWKLGQGSPRIVGRGELREVRWGRDELLQSAEAEFTVSEAAWELRNIRGRLGRGTISGQANGPLMATGPGAFQLTANRLELRRFLAPWPDVARQVEGTLDARFRGQLDSVWRGTAEMGVSRGRLAGVDLDRFRLPVDWSYSPARSRLALTVRETTLRIAQGRAVVRGEMSWDRELAFKGDARLVALDLRRLLRGMASPSSVPTGRLSGQLELSGNRVRSLRDLRGAFEGSLGDAQALRLPVLSALVPALGSGGQVASAVFEDSDIQLSLARGRVEVERLALASSAIQLLATGYVTLEGRLALDVTANLGQINTQTPLARALRATLLVSAPTVQLALLARANEWLTNRLLFLRIGGTTRSPTVQLRPGATVSREAIQFFLEDATGIPGLTPRGN
jgi:hypothetical protein